MRHLIAEGGRAHRPVIHWQSRQRSDLRETVCAIDTLGAEITAAPAKRRKSRRFMSLPP